MIHEQVRAKVLAEVAAGTPPMEVARKFHLSLITVGEIANPQMSEFPARGITAPKSVRSVLRDPPKLR